MRESAQVFVPPEDSYQAYTFMSFSVPENIWLEINEDLQKSERAFILNGLPGNSMREFSTRVAHLRKNWDYSPYFNRSEEI